MDDIVANALMVNATQRHASIVVQKSLQEGFGLTVTEAMWKSRPVLRLLSEASSTSYRLTQACSSRTQVISTVRPDAAVDAGTTRRTGHARASGPPPRPRTFPERSPPDRLRPARRAHQLRLTRVSGYRVRIAGDPLCPPGCNRATPGSPRLSRAAPVVPVDRLRLETIRDRHPDPYRHRRTPCAARIAHNEPRTARR